MRVGRRRGCGCVGQGSAGGWHDPPNQLFNGHDLLAITDLLQLIKHRLDAYGQTVLLFGRVVQLPKDLLCKGS